MSAEDEFAIRNTIVRYGLAADCGDIGAALDCLAPDALYIVSNPNAGRGGQSPDLVLNGHQAISEMLNSDMHQSLLPNCAHTVGPLAVSLKGNEAYVLGYSRVYYQSEGAPQLMRLAFNRWDMRKMVTGWKITKRESRVMGEAAAQKLLKEGLHAV